MLQKPSEIVQTNARADAKLYLSALFSVQISGTSLALLTYGSVSVPARFKVKL
jgi:hypothetical protein